MTIVFGQVEEYFSTARERYHIKLKRDAGSPPPWTQDKIMQEWRFTNVHREDDRTTVWYRNHIRQPLCERFHAQPTFQNILKIVEGTLIFRWFNRIETGERILDLLLGDWNTEIARTRLTGVNPVVTGAYIIKAGDGVSKLDGILNCIDEARPQLPRMIGHWIQCAKDGTLGLETAWTDLKQLHFMGGFMAYEVVTDLRHTPVLDKANDIMTWGNLGPGAIRGIGRVVANNPHLYANSTKSQKEMLGLMAELLKLSQDPHYWPQEWPAWEMHEVEMWLCEYAKYCNGKEGERLKRKYTYDNRRS